MMTRPIAINQIGSSSEVSSPTANAHAQTVSVKSAKPAAVSKTAAMTRENTSAGGGVNGEIGSANNFVMQSNLHIGVRCRNPFAQIGVF